jgi:hypothetical protein
MKRAWRVYHHVGGKLSRVEVIDMREIVAAPPIDLDSVIDPNFTAGMALNVDEMHTFDGSDLLSLDGKVNRADGKSPKICIPTRAPAPPAPPPHLFSGPHG